MLEVHLDKCPECRRYRKEMSGLMDMIRRAESNSEEFATTAFHRKVTVALDSESSRPAWGILPAGRTVGRDWRIALPTGAVVLMLIMGITHLHRSVKTVDVVSSIPRKTDRAEPANAEPTLANYQMAASLNFDQLTDLLNRQADTPLPVAPIYTAVGTTRTFAAE